VSEADYLRGSKYRFATDADILIDRARVNGTGHALLEPLLNGHIEPKTPGRRKAVAK
jgi:hypothetical protein